MDVVVNLDVEVGIPDGGGGGEENSCLGGELVVSFDMVNAEKILGLCFLLV